MCVCFSSICSCFLVDGWWWCLHGISMHIHSSQAWQLGGDGASADSPLPRSLTTPLVVGRHGTRDEPADWDTSDRLMIVGRKGGQARRPSLPLPGGKHPTDSIPLPDFGVGGGRAELHRLPHFLPTFPPSGEGRPETDRPFPGSFPHSSPFVLGWWWWRRTVEAGALGSCWVEDTYPRLLPACDCVF